MSKHQSRVDDEDPVTYASYLKLNPGILTSQEQKSDVHEELLFIVTHQAFELWFLVILRDLDFITDILMVEKETNVGNEMLQLNTCVTRICKIFKLVVQHFEILETMSPMAFLEFRGKLGSGSGFQSVQFRLIENKLGLEKDNRIQKNSQDYKTAFTEAEKEELLNSEKKSDDLSLINVLNHWLEKILLKSKKGSSFWKAYEAGWKAWIKSMFPDFQTEDGEDKQKYDKMEEMFRGVQSEVEYTKILGNDETYGERKRRLRHKAFQGALMIYLYREVPEFHEAYQFLTLILDLDALVQRWRVIHVHMVHRMIGNKPGTGGSTGVDYLLNTTKCFRYRVFIDLFDVSTYIIPKAFMRRFHELEEN